MLGARIAMMVICSLAAAVASCLGLVGCKGRDAAPSGQVVARIGSQDITELELDNELRQANVPFEKRRDPSVVKPVMSQLVLRKYLMQQALAARLDREPDVLLDILRSREQVMANAVLARHSASASVADADVERYMAQHPAKFAARQMLTVDEIRFALPVNASQVIDANKSATSMDAVDRQLSSLRVAHVRSLGPMNEGDLPEGMVSAIAAQKSGGILFARIGANGVYLQVKSAVAAPLEGDAAGNAARQALTAAMRREELATANREAQRQVSYNPDYARLLNDSAQVMPVNEPGDPAR
jgi:EpsD family peptidyl-prolyl cis-trans isomerase